MVNWKGLPPKLPESWGNHLKDTDKDGVPNVLDCKPHDPTRQGNLHDLWRKLKKRKEELEEKRYRKQRLQEAKRKDIAYLKSERIKAELKEEKQELKLRGEKIQRRTMTTKKIESLIPIKRQVREFAASPTAYAIFGVGTPLPKEEEKKKKKKKLKPYQILPKFNI